MPEYLTPLEKVWEALDGPYGDNATLYARTAQLVSDANFPNDKVFISQLFDRFIDKCKELGINPPYYEITIYMMSVAAGLYTAEQLTDLPPNPAKYGYHGDNKVLGELRDKLLRQQRKALDPTATLNALSDCLVAVFTAITRRLPPIAQGSDDGNSPADFVLTLPLVEVLPKVGSIIEDAIKPFEFPEAKRFGLFEWVRNRLAWNVEQITERSRGKRPIPPSHYEGSPAEVVSAYLDGTTIEKLFLQARVPFELPDAQRFSGHWIVAPSGRGKTTLLHSMFLDDVDREASIIIMDSKGDLINPIKELRDISDRLVLIEPDPDYPLALNPLDIPKTNIAHTVSLLEYIFSALLEAKMTALQMTLFRSVLPALVEVVPNPTLETFRDIITNGVAKYRPYIEQLPPAMQEFFLDETNGFSSKTYAETRNQLIWRLQFLMTNPVIKQMFSALKTKLDIGREMDAGKIILIDNSKMKLGDEGSEFFGRFFIALVLAAAQQRANRPHSEKLPCFFYIDECQNVIRRDEKIPTILDECRSQKIALILAHQRCAQITSTNVLDALANCAIRMANSDDDAKFLSERFRCDTDFLRSLPRGTFAAYVRDLTPAALAVKIPYRDLSKLPRLSAPEQRALRERMRSRYAERPVIQKPLSLVSPSPIPPPAPQQHKPIATGPPTPASQPPSAGIDPDAGAHTEAATKWGK